MEFHPNTIIIILCSIVILSYIFNIISLKTRVPSVLLLLSTGIGIKYLSRYNGYLEQDVALLVKVLGSIGLIMIILEAALDLEINRGKLKLIRDSFFAGLFIFLASAIGIAFLITWWLHEPFEKAMLYAIPMSIISSAVVIPSTSHLPESKKEFIIYESSISDIVGIMLFNYMLLKDILSLSSALGFAWNLLLAVIISIGASLLLIYILSRITLTVKFFLLFAILSLVYASSELIHLPSLIIILTFGLIINNASSGLRGWMTRIIGNADIESIISQLKSVTAETSFLIRTFFFILFGYTIRLRVLLQPEVWQLGTMIILVLLFVRFLYLRLILKSNLFPEILLMPRGLITILLFYSIPSEMAVGTFNVGVLFFVVVVTSILMMAGLLVFKVPEPGGEIGEEVE